MSVRLGVQDVMYRVKPVSQGSLSIIARYAGLDATVRSLTLSTSLQRYKENEKMFLDALMEHRIPNTYSRRHLYCGKWIFRSYA